jgi:hypothetical protein
MEVFTMLRLLVVSFFVCLTSFCLAGEDNPPGRYLSNGSFQFRNLHATLPDPTESLISQPSIFDPRPKIASIDWDPEIRLTWDLLAFYGTVAANAGYVHASASHASAMEPFYVRSTDNGDTWSEQFRLVDTSGVSALSPYFFVDSNFITYIFDGGGVFRSIYSSNNGETWSSWRHVYLSSNGFSAAKYDTTLYAGMSTTVHRFEFYYSTNHGYTWYRHSYKNELEGQSALGADSFGLHLVVEGYAQNIYYSRFSFADSNWSDIIRISDTLAASSFDPAMVVWGDSNIAVIWLDYKYSNYPWTGDILMRHSTDNGFSWLDEQQLTFNHLAFDKNITERNDSLFMIYDEVASNGNSEAEDIFFNLSTDGGISWGEPVRVTDAPFRSIYPSVAVDGNYIHVVYCDARDDTLNGNHNDLYYRRGVLSGDRVRDDNPNNPNDISLYAYPNPFNSATTITLTGAEQAEIGIYDITGRLITTLKAENGRALWDASAYSSGLYFARVAGEKTSTIKLVLVK